MYCNLTVWLILVSFCLCSCCFKLSFPYMRLHVSRYLMVQSRCPCSHRGLQNVHAELINSVWHLWGKEGERSLDQKTHQPLGVEDELIAAGFLVSKCGWSEKKHARLKMLVPAECRAGFCNGSRCSCWCILPDDGVHAPDLGCALQNTEGLGKGLGLVCRSQGCPVTTATNSRAEVMPRKRSRKRKRWTDRNTTNTSDTCARPYNTATHADTQCEFMHRIKKSSHMMFQ